MKTVLIDDEALARAEMRRLLATHPDVEIVGEAANATEALRLLPTLRPDLVFLDIEMPGRTGFDLLAAWPAPHPEIIFVTAYDAFALRAFEVNALDYLLKPVNPLRLATALDRLRERRVEGGPPGDGPAAADGVLPRFAEDDQVFVRDGDRCWFIPVREIMLLESEGNHTRLLFRAVQPLLHRALLAMEHRLPETLFFRANRGQVVNRLFVERVEPWFSGGLKVGLRGGLEVELSRRQAQVFRDRLGL
jgi:two-component system LytT family response regulator